MRLGSTTASAAWLLFNKMQPRGALTTVLHVGMAEASVLMTVHLSHWPPPSCCRAARGSSMLLMEMTL